MKTRLKPRFHVDIRFDSDPQISWSKSYKLINLTDFVEWKVENEFDKDDTLDLRLFFTGVCISK